MFGSKCSIMNTCSSFGLRYLRIIKVMDKLGNLCDKVESGL
jgi:hypothetical protein